MTLNILFFTVTIKKRAITPEEIFQDEMIRKIEEENRNRQSTLPRMF